MDASFHGPLLGCRLGTFVALCGETQLERGESSDIRGYVRRNALSQVPAGTYVALCGETQAESGESSDIRGLVRRNAPSQGANARPRG